jgi:apolipoprotein D and lipocalin family protein
LIGAALRAPVEFLRQHLSGAGLKRASMLFCVSVLGACTSVPDGVTPVSPFDLDRYLGRWYEIARLDHSFERGLSDVTADYRLQADGSVEVTNRGYDGKKAAWREAVGRAVFIGDPTTGSLKVSFFGPFYGGYHIADLDQQGYRWALVTGPDRDYLWILARTPDLPAEVRERLVSKASALGFDTTRLIWVEHKPLDVSAPVRASAN